VVFEASAWALAALSPACTEDTMANAASIKQTVIFFIGVILEMRFGSVTGVLYQLQRISQRFIAS
jgi:hypothetical protein